jgi:hypothetical protein
MSVFEFDGETISIKKVKKASCSQTFSFLRCVTARPDAQALTFIKYIDPLFLCKTGGRGALAVNTLKLMGYEQIVSLQGGIDSWVSVGNPIEK